MQLAADFGRVAVGPDALDDGLAGVAVADFGDAALVALTAAGVFGGGRSR